MKTTDTKELAERWGLPIEAIESLSKRLITFHSRYREGMRSQTAIRVNMACIT